ncbi:MAG TPA: ribose-phosphate diphosphokinase, partial [Actinobacteria bacterium]|nr:ribose-phosphate diphosphokinase [Actinomycetota bacterium]
MLFSGRSNLDLGLKIAEHLGIVLGDLELKTFSNQEIYVRYKENIR